MSQSTHFCWIAARGASKTFSSAIFCCVRAILYPGSKIVIASGTRKQANEVLLKIKLELMSLSPNLRNEISSVSINSMESLVEFHNGSYIKAVVSNDNARGARANVLIVDEFRLVDKETIDTILKKFLTVRRQPGYLNNPEYAGLIEPNKQLYLSSAWYKSHWSYEKVKDFFANMLDCSGRFFACSLPYQLSIKEGFLSKEDVESDMLEANFNEVSWSMEMDALFFGDDGNAFFSFDPMDKARTLKYPMLPGKLAIKLNNSSKIRIPAKQPDEIRLVSMDVALMSSRKYRNDASAIFVDQLLPSRGNRFVNNIVYTESMEGEHTFDQALELRKLYEEYDADYIVIDARGVGAGVVDTLVRDIIDPTTGEIYPALSCCNDPEWASRCSDPDAKKAIWVIQASSRLNSDCALLLREGFRSGKIRLLQSEVEGDKNLSVIKGYSSLSQEDKLRMQTPYINTTLLISELIRLKHDEVGGLVKILTQGTARKDRYSGLSYVYYVACQLETKHQKRNNNFDISSAFVFKAPTAKSRR